jgi:acid phosphatase type 7
VLRAPLRGPWSAGWLAAAAIAIAIAGGVILVTRGGGHTKTPRGGSYLGPVRGERAVIWAVGDGADGSDHARAVAARIARGPVDRVLYLGDVYDNGTAREFRANYAPTYGRLARVTAPTAGNHDAPNETSGYDPYWRGVHGTVPPDWYAFRAGGWQIISLDSEDAHAAGSPQQRWLEDHVSAPGNCRIAYWHRARFSADTHHGDQSDMAPLWNALRGHAAIAVAGHAHDMQRLRPIDGITEFVAGAGGAALYPLRRDDRLAFGDDHTYGALRLQLSPGAAHYAFVAADGRVLDAGTVHCRS